MKKIILLLPMLFLFTISIAQDNSEKKVILINGVATEVSLSEQGDILEVGNEEPKHMDAFDKDLNQRKPKSIKSKTMAVVASLHQSDNQDQPQNKNLGIE